LWLFEHREAAMLFLQLPSGWRLIAGIVTTLVIVALMIVQGISAGRADEATRAALRPKLGYAVPILPRTASERDWFMALSATAGVCEELIYRGFVVWALVPWLGLWGAAFASIAGFGVAHAYLGREGMLRATLAGVVLGLVVLMFRSLYPAMILHAALDMGAGAVGFALLRDAPANDLPGGAG